MMRLILNLQLIMWVSVGLERTDNNMELTTWPQVNMINQKNYYTSVTPSFCGVGYLFLVAYMRSFPFKSMRCFVLSTKPLNRLFFQRIPEAR